jgi:hypothetical protein
VFDDEDDPDSDGQDEEKPPLPPELERRGELVETTDDGGGTETAERPLAGEGETPPKRYGTPGGLSDAFTCGDARARGGGERNDPPPLLFERAPLLARCPLIVESACVGLGVGLGGGGVAPPVLRCGNV